MTNQVWLCMAQFIVYESPSLPTRSPTQRAATRCFSRFVEAKFALVFHAFSPVPHAHSLASHPSNSSPNWCQAYNQARHQGRQQLSESSRCILNDCFPDLTASLLDNTVPQNLGEVGLRMMKHSPIHKWSGQQKLGKIRMSFYVSFWDFLQAPDATACDARLNMIICRIEIK